MSVLLEARDLGVALPGEAGAAPVFERVSLSVSEGDIIDVAGPSGSGKTTLLRALARLIPQTTGELLLDGHPSVDVVPTTWRMLVALVPQVPAIVPGTLRQNLSLPWTLRVRRGALPPGDAELERELASLGLELALDRDASRLSVGQRARVALARTLLTEPQVLLLDEPDAALDPDSAEAVGRAAAAFAARGGAVVRVRHRDSDGRATIRYRLADRALTEVTS